VKSAGDMSYICVVMIVKTNSADAYVFVDADDIQLGTVMIVRSVWRRIRAKVVAQRHPHPHPRQQR
jgi:hypothetical protein